MTVGARAGLYVLAAVLGAANYWILEYFVTLETTVQRSVWTAASLGFLLVGWIAVAFWASAHLPSRLRWRGIVRSSVMILAGTAGLLDQGGFASAVWVAISLAFIAILISELFLRSRQRHQRAPQPD